MSNWIGRPRPATLMPATLMPATLMPATLITAAIGLTLLTAACGGNSPAASPDGSRTSSATASSQPGSQPSSQPGTQPAAPSALAFARCVRTHGVPSFPDPPPHFTGKFPGAKPQQLGVSVTQLRAATAACQSLLPPEPGQAPLTAQEQQDYLRAAACMRSHGVTIFPDPVFSGGGVSFPTPAAGFDTSSPQFTHAAQICRRLIPAGLPYSS